MKKTVLFITLLALISLIFAGCAGTPAPESPSPAQPSPSADASAAPSAAAGEKIKVGIVLPMDHPSLNTIKDSIIAELEAQGYGDRLEIDVKNAQGDASTVSTIISQFIGNDVDVIVPIATGPAQTAAAATKDIPIVFAAVSYPVEAGLVSALDKTDGNVTGVTNAIAIDEIFTLAGTLTPEAKTFGFVYNTGEVNAVSSIDRAKAYCDAHGLSYRDAIITNTGELQQAAQSLAGKVDAIFTPNDNMVASAMPVLAGEGIKAKLPVYVGADSMVKDGGFASVGIDYTILGKQVAQMIIRVIVDGQSIAENPIEVVSEYAKLINTTTAKAIDVEIPEELLKTFTILE